MKMLLKAKKPFVELLCLKILLLLLFFLLLSSTISAQKNGIIKGIVIDTLSQKTVEQVTVTLFLQNDSTLVSFSMTEQDGKFEMDQLANGKYRLLFTHLSFQNKVVFFEISDKTQKIDLGNIFLSEKINQLKEVQVKMEAPPVTLLNDTIQYNASSFKVPVNANVEQLLKKMPGISIDKDGNIKAQGERIGKVLVDGKEFFGNDPKLATKNLPADAIDKVQVFDKKSEQATLTGFDDGNSEKTINLKLKEDKKQGVFGKVNGGAGTKEKYEGKFNVNSFKKNRQLSTLGMANNDNSEGFSIIDILNFSGELNRMARSGIVNINFTDEEAAALGINTNRNTGINTARGAGVNYNNIFGKKVDLQSNYFYNYYNPTQESQVRRQYFLPDSSYFYNQNTKSNNISQNNKLNFNVLYEINKKNSIRIIPSLAYQSTNNASNISYQNLTENQVLRTEGFSDFRQKNEGYNLKNDIVWSHKFDRKGRTFSLTLQSTLNQSQGSGSLLSSNKYYNTDLKIGRIDSLNQINNTSAKQIGNNLKAIYTEPLWERSLLELNITKGKFDNFSDKNTFDFNQFSNKYDIENRNLSNQFENTYDFTTTGFRLRTVRKKYNVSIGANFQIANLTGKTSYFLSDSLTTKTFKNILPNGRVVVNFSRYKTLNINYATSTKAPNISQLQPVPDNSNALNIKVGNPNLKQEYNHLLQMRLNLIKPFSNRNLFAFVYLQSTENKIVNEDTFNKFGVRQSKPVNTNGVYSVNSSISYSLPVTIFKGTLELRGETSFLQTKQFINGTTVGIKSTTFRPEIRQTFNLTKKLDFDLAYNLGNFTTKYALENAQQTKYISQEFNANLNWDLPKGFHISSDFLYLINSQRSAGYNLKIPILNASISKQMLKYNRGELKFIARDILNRNIGISRNSNNSYIEDSRVLTLRQFFILSFTYSLSKTGLTNESGSGHRMIIR